MHTLTHSLSVDVLCVHINVLVVVAHEQAQALWVAIHSYGRQIHTHARAWLIFLKQQHVFHCKSQTIYIQTDICVYNCLHVYLQHVWLSFCVCSHRSWVRSRGAAVERHTPDDLWSRPGWGGSGLPGCKRPLPAVKTREPLKLHSVRGKPKSLEDTHQLTALLCQIVETVKSSVWEKNSHIHTQTHTNLWTHRQVQWTHRCLAL